MSENAVHRQYLGTIGRSLEVDLPLGRNRRLLEKVCAQALSWNFGPAVGHWRYWLIIRGELRQGH